MHTFIRARRRRIPPQITRRHLRLTIRALLVADAGEVAAGSYAVEATAGEDTLGSGTGDHGSLGDRRGEGGRVGLVYSGTEGGTGWVVFDEACTLTCSSNCSRTLASRSAFIFWFTLERRIVAWWERPWLPDMVYLREQARFWA